MFVKFQYHPTAVIQSTCRCKCTTCWGRHAGNEVGVGISAGGGGSKAWFPLPELTARVDEYGPSTRLVETSALLTGNGNRSPVRQLGPLTRAVNSGSGNRAPQLLKLFC